jgi:Xaa-Pro dipeptidase
MAYLNRVIKIMDQEGFNGLIATSAANLFYFSGFRNPGLSIFPYESQNYLVIARDNIAHPILVAGQGDLDLIPNQDNLSDTVSFGSFTRFISDDVELTPAELLLKSRALDRKSEHSPEIAIKKAIMMADLDSGTIGLDERGFSLNIEEILNHLPRVNIVPASKKFAEIRMIKTLDEIEKLKSAVEVTEQSLLAGIKQAREGISEWEMERIIKQEMISRDAIPDFVLLKFGRNGGFQELASKDVYLKRGDTIWVDLGCRLNGYCSDIARTFAFGQPTNKVRVVYNALLEGENEALEYIRPGVTAKEVFEKTVKAVQRAGLPQYDRHHVGHGIGLDTYDPPLLSADDLTVLEAGMVINIEPPYYEIGLGAIHVEDTFVVTEKGVQLLTSINRSLQVID